MSKIYYDVQAGAPHACETRRQTLRQLRFLCHSGQRGAEQESGVSEESRRLSGGRERANTGWTNSYCVTGHSGTQEVSNQASLDLSLSGVSFMLWCWASFFSLSSFRQVTGGRVRGSFWVFLFLNNQLKVNIQKRILIFLTKEKRSFWMIAERGGWNLCLYLWIFFLLSVLPVLSHAHALRLLHLLDESTPLSLRNVPLHSRRRCLFWSLIRVWV